MTPIELLLERLADNGILHSSDIAEANELFKQQIIDAHIHGGEPDWDGVQLQAEQYYNKTFKNTNK